MSESNKYLFIPQLSSTSYSQFLSMKQTHSFEETTGTFIDQEFFKRFVSFHYQHIYLNKKKQNRIYQILFFSFGLLFSILSLLIFFKTTNPTSHIYFKNGMALKYYINYGCILLSAGAFGIGLFTQPEKEAMKDLVYRVQREFHHPGRELNIRFQTFFNSL